MGKFHNLQSFPQGLGGGKESCYPKGTVIRPLRYVEQNGYLKIFIGRLCGKIRPERKAFCPPISLVT